MGRIAAMSILFLLSSTPILAGGVPGHFPRTVIVQEVRTITVVAPDPEPCRTYAHAIWIRGEAIVRPWTICRWPDGTLREGPRPY